MSGFIAVFHRSGRPVERQLIRCLTDALSDRGPDGSGLWCGGPVGLGHALLRTSAEAEEQAGPLTAGDVHLVGDVRLDDREVLLSFLAERGYPVDAGTPDSALLLHAYRANGERCLDDLAGDFSFCLWDERRQLLFAARDHFGIMPLFFADAGDALIISNSLLCLMAHPAVDLGLSNEMIADHLAVGMRMRRGATFYAGIRRLENGCRLIASAGAIDIAAYWTPQEPAPSRHRHAGDYVEEFRELFYRAVRDRLRCDRVATDLSGGMDASSIATSVALLWGGAATTSGLKAYSFYYRDLIADDEGRLSEMIAARHGMPLELIPIEPLLDGAFGLAPGHVSPEPAQSLISAHAAVIPRAAAHARILLRGFGGDPLFGLGELPPAGIGEILRAVPDMAIMAARYRRKPWLGLRQRWTGARRTPPVLRPDTLLDADFAASHRIDDRRRDFLGARVESGRTGMARSMLWANIFDRADADCTGVPLAVRYPFFDLRLVRFLDRVPPLPWQPDKTLLRLSMAGQLPEAVVRRRKTPVAGVPIKQWLQRVGPPPWMLDLLALSDLRPYIDHDAVIALLRDPDQLDFAATHQLYSMLGLAVWLRDLPSLHARPALMSEG